MGRLLEAARTTRPNTGGVRSSIDVWLDTLTDEDRDDALTVLRDPTGFGHAHVAQLIADVHGQRFSPAVVRIWRVRQGVL